MRMQCQSVSDGRHSSSRDPDIATRRGDVGVVRRSTKVTVVFVVADRRYRPGTHKLPFALRSAQLRVVDAMRCRCSCREEMHLIRTTWMQNSTTHTARHRFNMATAHELRKASEPTALAAGSCAASMGPQLMSCGKAVCLTCCGATGQKRVRERGAMQWTEIVRRDLWLALTCSLFRSYGMRATARVSTPPDRSHDKL